MANGTQGQPIVHTGSWRATLPRSASGRNAIYARFFQRKKQVKRPCGAKHSSHLSPRSASPTMKGPVRGQVYSNTLPPIQSSGTLTLRDMLGQSPTAPPSTWKEWALRRGIG
ncbi:Hypothetical predicted protein [Pelobates cultripes]|uniref:Uncharacterized protein n=1 Tax=Pelobates cultripes TaxID=61616 RepID=A0AAD1T490_PELCU|nr:Hypothetical predicted protein [Pelobates cultripes]